MPSRFAHVVGQPEAHRHFLSGINAVADLLAPTLGPLGGRVAGSSTSMNRLEVWDDAGTTVRRLISLGNPQADVGAMLLRNMVWRMEQRVGDGGTAAAVLARALTRRGMRLLAAGVNAVELGRGLRQASETVVAALRAQAYPIDCEDALSQLALTVTGNPELSSVLGELRFLLGPEGHVLVEKYVAPWLERRYISGAHFASQIASMYFYNDRARRAAVLTAPAVALLDEPLTSSEAALALLEATLQRESSALLILAPEVSGQALNLLVTNQQAPADKRKLTILAAKLTALVDERNTQLADLAALTNAAILGNGRSSPVSRVRVADLGDARRVEFAHEALTVITHDAHRASLRREAEAVQARLAALPFDDTERPALTRRLATLTGGIGELKVGAASEAERALLFETATRTLRVLTSAQRTGVVPGAGAALIHAIPAVQAIQVDGDAAYGVRLLAEALPAILQQIARNAGVDHPAGVAHKVAEAGPPTTWDALSGRIVDAQAAGIVDGADITIAILVNAVSCALMALTTDVIVYHAKPKTSMEP